MKQIGMESLNPKIHNEGELDEISIVKDSLIVRQEGNRT